MKKLLILFFMLLTVNSYAQRVTEKKIISLPSVLEENYYDFKYDEKSGTYARLNYDSLADKYTLISNKGNSKEYSYINIYNLIFDKEGNYYVIAENNITDSESKSYFLRNGKEISNYSSISSNIKSDGDYVYFAVSDNDKGYIGKYNVRKEKLEKGKTYDHITFCAMDDQSYGEPSFSLGFTDSGEIYYIAGLDGNEIMVVGDKESKPYTYIDLFSVKKDLEGDLCYIATNENESYSRFVQGSKEYDKFSYVRTPVAFEKDNTPVYVAEDMNESDINGGMLMRGNKRGKYYKGGISDIAISPSGKIAYVASESDDTDAKSFVVFGGKEGKRYQYVYDLTFNEDEKLIYIASDEDKTILVVDGKETSTKHNNIYSLVISPQNKICFIGMQTKEEDSSKADQYYYHIGDKVFGPYINSSSEYETGFEDILFGEKEKFAFITSDSKSSEGDTFYYKVVTDKWTSEEFDYVESLKIIDNDVYYLGYNGKKDINNIYKNKGKISGDYKKIIELVYDDDIIRFIGIKNDTYYYVTIEL